MIRLGSVVTYPPLLLLCHDLLGTRIRRHRDPLKEHGTRPSAQANFLGQVPDQSGVGVYGVLSYGLDSEGLDCGNW